MVVQGTIQDLDTITRQLFVLVNGEIIDLDVPVTCPVYVNEERVKMRLLQRLDHVMVNFKNEDERAVAESIEVRPAHPSALPNRSGHPVEAGCGRRQTQG